MSVPDDLRTSYIVPLYLVYSFRRTHLIHAAAIDGAVRTGHLHLVEPVQTACLVVVLPGGSFYAFPVLVPLISSELQVAVTIRLTVLVTAVHENHVIPLAVHETVREQREREEVGLTLARPVAFAGIEDDGHVIRACGHALRHRNSYPSVCRKGLSCTGDKACLLCVGGEDKVVSVGFTFADGEKDGQGGIGRAEVHHRLYVHHRNGGRLTDDTHLHRAAVYRMVVHHHRFVVRTQRVRL